MRKDDVLSVDPAGSLGALLDGRYNPRPVIGTLWFKSRHDVVLLTTRIARAAASGESAPFEEMLEEVLPSLKYITLMPDTIQMIGNDVVFSVKALDNNSRTVQIWIRARTDRSLAEKTLEQRLFEALSNVQK